jgi:hypothetical protein
LFPAAAEFAARVRHHGHDHHHGEAGHDHTHGVPSRLTFRGLLALGISGGIVPCPTALVVLPIIAGCSLLLISGRQAGFFTLLTYFGAVGILITAKPMYVPFAAILVPFGIYLSRMVSFRFRNGFTTAVCVFLIVLAIGYQAITPGWLRMKASYIAIFSELLKNSPNPNADLLALDLNPEWIRYVGSTPYDSDGPVETDPAFPAEFMKHIHTLTIPKYLLTHPAQLYRVASRIAPQLVITLPDYAGYYEESTGRPARTKPVAPWSSIRARIFPASLWLVILYFCTGMLAFAAGLRSRGKLRRGLLLVVRTEFPGRFEHPRADRRPAALPARERQREAPRRRRRPRRLRPRATRRTGREP